MIELRVNGITKDVSKSATDLAALLNQLRVRLNGKDTVISSILVDGQEVAAHSDGDLRKRNLSDIRRIDVRTKHPKELVDESLEILMGFSDAVSQRSRELANKLNEKTFVAGFLSLLQGIEVIAETVTMARQSLGIEEMPELDLLYDEMTSLLNKLVTAAEKRNDVHLRDILGTQIPAHLARWKNIGIPVLRQSRDS